jgi:hypothetical protein
VSIGNVDTSGVGLTAPALLRPQPAQANTANGTGGANAVVGTHGASASDPKAPLPGRDSNSVLTSLDTQSAVDSLQDQIRAARAQLNDWVTCVSATTPQGKAEIRSLSTQISAAEEQIDRLPPATGATAGGASVDLWA